MIPSGTTVTWKKIENGEIVGDVENAKLPNPPVGEKAMREYVEMMWQNRVQKLDIGVLNTSISKVKVDYPVFDFVEDGCHFRANLVAEELMSKGIKCKKIWAFGDLSISSQYIVNPSTPNNALKKIATWPYHVAIIVEGIDNSGKIVKMVIDPSISDSPMTTSAWMSSFNTKPMTEMANFELLKMDYEIATETGTGKYFINKSLHAGRPLNGKTVVPRGDIYFETDVEILGWGSLFLDTKFYKTTFDDALKASLNFLPELVKQKKWAVMATQVDEGIKSNINELSLFEKIDFMYTYRQNFSDVVRNNIKNSSFSADEMYDAISWLYERRTMFSDANYIDRKAGFQAEMTKINGNYQLFKQKYYNIVQEVAERLHEKKQDFLLLF